MNKSKFAIVDCNNFFVSCERIFQPKLNNVPVVVLSNNDGCIIARSNEAKQIGIKMGEPLFKAKGLINKYNVKVFSSNFSLYNDISNRIMDILFKLAPEVSVYSVDEAFLDLTSLNKNYNLSEFCCDIVEKIAKYTSIPVSIGIGPSKTLAKAANHYCKRQNAKYKLAKSPIYKLKNHDDLFDDIFMFKNLDKIPHQVRDDIVEVWDDIVEVRDDVVEMRDDIAEVRDDIVVSSRNLLCCYPGSNLIKGVFDISCKEMQYKVLTNFDVGDVWGIGRQWKKKLNKLGIFNVWQLINIPSNLIKENFNIVLYRTIQELKGISCISLEDTEHNKQILVSRSFGKRIEDITSIKEAVAFYTTKASEKLRSQQLAAKNITVFMHTNMFSEYEPKYRASMTTELDIYTNDTRKLIKAALSIVEKIYKSGYRYKKAGIMLSNLTLMDNLQLDMFSDQKQDASACKLMKAIDNINAKLGRSSISFAACGIKRNWRMRSNLSSKIALSNWDKLPVVRA